jgi:UDP-3-O-[3-hydroxymyristoyl] N-acetylglucosamine deacetylase
VNVSGHGLHSNRTCCVTVHSVDRPTGLRFLFAPKSIEIPAIAELTGDLTLATSLVHDGVKLQTVEHLLSALAGLQIEHALIEVDSEELPILDGSAARWVNALREGGMKALPGPRRLMRIQRLIEVQGNGKWIRVSPHKGLRIRYTIDFDHPSIGRQTREMSITPEKYQREVASARTFCLERDVETMRSHGLALGGSLENALVFGPQGPLNDALRFEDEAVRHKILDLVGDLALLGAPLEGFVEVFAGGHALHVALAKAILEDSSAWSWSESEDVSIRRPVFHPTFPAPHPLPA